MARQRLRSAGFSLIELLVVMAVIGILAGLVLSAVQSTRHAAYRAKCQNNMKQIGVALHNYHNVHGAFPAQDTDLQPQYYWTWLAKILPHIEQDNLYRQAEEWRDGGPPGNERWAPWYTNMGAEPQNPVLAHVVPMYVCPLDTITHKPTKGFY